MQGREGVVWRVAEVQRLPGKARQTPGRRRGVRHAGRIQHEYRQGNQGGEQHRIKGAAACRIVAHRGQGPRKQQELRQVNPDRCRDKRHREIDRRGPEHPGRTDLHGGAAQIQCVKEQVADDHARPEVGARDGRQSQSCQHDTPVSVKPDPAAVAPFMRSEYPARPLR